MKKLNYLQLRNTHLEAENLEIVEKQKMNLERLADLTSKNEILETENNDARLKAK